MHLEVKVRKTSCTLHFQHTDDSNVLFSCVKPLSWKQQQNGSNPHPRQKRCGCVYHQDTLIILKRDNHVFVWFILQHSYYVNYCVFTCLYSGQCSINKGTKLVFLHLKKTVRRKQLVCVASKWFMDRCIYFSIIMMRLRIQFFYNSRLKCEKHLHIPISYVNRPLKSRAQTNATQWIRMVIVLKIL